MKRIKSSLEIPSISNSGMKVAPISQAYSFMQVHKLDYKKQTLIRNIEKHQTEINKAQKLINKLEAEISSILKVEGFVKTATVDEVVQSTTSTSKVLKY